MKVSKTIITVLTALVILTFAAMPAIGGQPKTAKKPTALEGKLNINTATVKQLTLLPGVGKKTAENIIAYRTQNGNFKAVENLVKVKGFGKKTLGKSKVYITLEGESTLKKAKKG